MGAIPEIAGNVLLWLFVGLASGWLAARFMRSASNRPASSMIAGMVGALIGGAVFTFIMTGGAGFWGSLIGAIIGAHLFIAMFRFLGFGRART